MTEEEREIMRKLFSKYCRSEVEARNCQPGDCEYCPIDSAYDRIFQYDEDVRESDIEY